MRSLYGLAQGHALFFPSPSPSSSFLLYVFCILRASTYKVLLLANEKPIDPSFGSL